MSAIWSRIQREPALVSGLLAAILALFLAFGLQLSTQQVGALMAVAAAALALVTRHQVAPVSTVAAQLVDGRVVAGPAAPVDEGVPVTVVSALR